MLFLPTVLLVVIFMFTRSTVQMWNNMLLLPAFPLSIITSYTLRNKTHRYSQTQTKIKASGESPFIPSSHSCERLCSMHTLLPSVLMERTIFLKWCHSVPCCTVLCASNSFSCFFKLSIFFLCIPCMIQRDYETDGLWDKHSLYKHIQWHGNARTRTVGISSRVRLTDFPSSLVTSFQFYSHWIKKQKNHYLFTWQLFVGTFSVHITEAMATSDSLVPDGIRSQNAHVESTVWSLTSFWWWTSYPESCRNSASIFTSDISSVLTLVSPEPALHHKDNSLKSGFRFRKILLNPIAGEQKARVPFTRRRCDATWKGTGRKVRYIWCFSPTEVTQNELKFLLCQTILNSQQLYWYRHQKLPAWNTAWTKLQGTSWIGSQAAQRSALTASLAMSRKSVIRPKSSSSLSSGCCEEKTKYSWCE